MALIQIEQYRNRDELSYLLGPKKLMSPKNPELSKAGLVHNLHAMF